MIVGNDDWTLNIKEKFCFIQGKICNHNVTFDILQQGIRDVYV